LTILILTTHLNVGGIPQYVINLSRALAQQGNKVFVGSSSGVWAYKLKDLKNVSNIYLPLKTKSILSIKIIFCLFKLIPFVKRANIDIIHANTRVSQYLAYLIYKISGIPYVSVFHNCYKPHIFRKLFKFEGVKSIAVSNFVRAHLISSLSLSKEKIETVYNGIDTDCSPDLSLDSDLYSLKQRLKGFRIVGMVCRLTPEKNVDLMVKSVPLLLKKYPYSKVVVLGQGRQEQELLELTETLGLTQNVFFIKGFSPRQVFSLFDVFVSLTRGEPFGLTVIEAQVCRVPVVVTPSGAFRETVIDRVTGLILKGFTPEAIVDGISQVWQDKELRLALVSNAFEQARDNFSLDVMGRRTFDLYSGIIKANFK
jgi:glycosyltransferase involved in cell wall biosynthesis